MKKTTMSNKKSAPDKQITITKANNEIEFTSVELLDGKERVTFSYGAEYDSPREMKKVFDRIFDFVWKELQEK